MANIPMSQDHNIPCSPVLIQRHSSPVIKIPVFTLLGYFKAVRYGGATKHT